MSHMKTPVGKPFTFVHAADLHLGTPFKDISTALEGAGKALQHATLDAFDQLVALCVEKEAAFLLIAGDLFDGPNRGVRAQLRLQRGLERLHDSNIPVFIAAGNHDPLKGGWPGSDRWPPNVHVFPPSANKPFPVEKDGEAVALVHGVSYSRQAEKNDLASKLARTESPNYQALYQIGVVHATVGTYEAHESYAPTTLENLRATGLDYLALGHVHTFTVVNEADPVVAYPGNIQALSPREMGAKGALLVSVDAAHRATLEFVELDSVRFVEEEIDLGDTDSLAELSTLLQEGAAAAREEGGARAIVLRVILKGRTPLYSQLARPGDIEQLTSELREAEVHGTPPLWWNRIANATSPELDIEALEKQGGLESELIGLARTLSEDDALLSGFADEALVDLYKKPEVARLLGPRPEGAELEAELQLARDLALDLLKGGL